MIVLQQHFQTIRKCNISKKKENKGKRDHWCVRLINNKYRRKVKRRALDTCKTVVSKYRKQNSVKLVKDFIEVNFKVWQRLGHASFTLGLFNGKLFHK